MLFLLLLVASSIFLSSSSYKGSTCNNKIWSQPPSIDEAGFVFNDLEPCSKRSLSGIKEWITYCKAVWVDPESFRYDGCYIYDIQ